MFFYHIAPLGVRSPSLTYTAPKPLAVGTLVGIQIRKKVYDGVVVAQAQAPDFTCKNIIDTRGYFGSVQRFLARFIAYYYRVSLPEAYKLFIAFAHTHTLALVVPSKQNLNPLSSGALRFCDMPLHARFNHAQKQQISSKLPALSPAQAKAYAFIESKPLSLLFGDTGSGKTEIYFHAIARALCADKTVLFLMPEIALTPQTLARLQAVFGDCVALWHSKVAPRKKKEILQGLYNQQIKIIAGARSALFLPLANLGVVIVDEEHDDAYKSMSSPRYNARDLAVLLSRHAGVKAILGSATPSLTSYKIARDEGYLYRLKGGFYQAHRQFILESTQASLTDTLKHHIQVALAQKRQVIVFVPTRANFKALLCLECGYGFVCPFCSVNMSVHLSRNALCCHYCDYREILPSLCPKCSGENLSSKRIGTAQVATQLQELYPLACIGVFDRDHITTQTKLATMLSAFKSGEIDILVGTQMLSKGHDYHNVALACVIGIDYVLQGGDFRSFERGVALLHQIAGRAGRKESGKVFIQSLQSEWLKGFLDDYEVFLQWELAYRSSSYPPFRRLAMIHCDHRSKAKAQESMLAILRVLQKQAGDSVEVLGYGANAIERIADKWRFHILLTAQKHSDILRAMENLGEIEVDIDCIDTL